MPPADDITKQHRLAPHLPPPPTLPWYADRKQRIAVMIAVGAFCFSLGAVLASFL